MCPGKALVECHIWLAILRWRAAIPIVALDGIARV
jgi:hypothetical protein